MSQQTFSRRTVAIAVAASVAVTTAPAIGTSSPLATIAPTANAQDITDQKPGVNTGDVKYLGIFDANGKVSGPFESSNYSKTQNSTGRVLGKGDGYEIRGEFSLANANPGDELRLVPTTKFTFPNGDTGTTSRGGLRISQSSEWADVTHDGTVIGQYRYTQSGSIQLKFNDAVADVKSGSVTLSAPAMVWDFYTGPEKNGFEGESWDGKRFSNPVETTSKVNAVALPANGDNVTTEIGTIGTVRFNIATSSSTKNALTAYESGALVVDTENFTVRRPDTVIRIPAGANGTLTLKPNIDHEKGADWYLTDNITFTPFVNVYGKAGTDEEYEAERLTYEEAQKQFPGLKIKAEQTGRGITITTSGVPENVKPFVTIKPGKDADAIAYGTYVEGASLYYTGEFTGTINDQDTTKKLGNIVGTMAAIPGQPSVSGLENAKRTGELSGSIAGQPAGLGVDGSVAPVGGTKQTFQFFIKNTGDAPLVAPIVTLPNGKKQAIKGIAIAPNGTGSFSVDYDVPADNGALNFDVSLSRATLSPSNTVSFRYSVADQADSAASSITYKEKKAPRGQVTTVTPSGVPKGASAARIPDTPAWAEIGANGTLTLKPDNSAPLGRTEIPVKFTFSDGSTTTVNPVITVAEHDPNAKGPGTFDPRTEDEKSNDEINDRLDKLEEATNKQTDKLDEIGTALDESNKLTKDQIDAINDQTKKIGKAIEDQSKAIDALKEATEKGDKAIVDAMKEQSKAIDSALNSIETTIREGDAAALEEAKKQTAQLDKNNTLIAAQNKELANQTEQLKAQSATLKKQAATLDKVRAELDKANKLTEEQNKLIQDQIDAINAQTEAIGDLIDATEKQTAEITARLDDANKIAAEQRDIFAKELAESIKQTAEMKRQSKALERQNQILIDQHKDQLAQWEKENKFAQNEQDDRRHKDNFKRCITSDPATAALISLPIISLLAAVGVPYTGHMLEDANKQLTALNNQLGTQVGIPADLRAQVNDFNANYGDMVRTGATALAGIGAVVGLAVAINNLTGGCYAEADKSVGREPQAPKTSSDSVLSSKPWVQETAAPKAKDENTDAEAENAEVATQ